MKYIFLALLSGLLLIACNTNDKKAEGRSNKMNDSLAQKAMSDSTNFTTIQWLDSTTQDLGKINEGQMVEISWRFRNTGNKPLIIANVSPGCGCTVADKPEEPIAPGNEGVIKARFDSKGHPGQATKNVNVRANTKDNVTTLLFRVYVTKQQ
ncbi:MAG: DUF1573 domain-containing protein [Chitinophagaceae bacterium]